MSPRAGSQFMMCRDASLVFHVQASPRGDVARKDGRITPSNEREVVWGCVIVGI